MTPHPTPDHPQVRDAATHIVIMLNEVEAGVRSARQVTPLFAVHLRGALARLAGRPGPVAELRRLVITPSGAGTWELLAVCRRGDRVTATSLRLCRTDAGWLVTDLAHPRVRPDAAAHMSDPPSRAGVGPRPPR